MLAEEPPRPDEAPDHRRVEGDPVLGARPGAVRVQRLHVADVLDAVQHPPCHRQVHHAGDHRAHQLGGVHAAWRDLHVVSELEVGEEGQRVHGADPAVDLEEQVGDGLAGQRVADHELRDDVVPGLLVGGGLDDADGEGDHEGEREGEEHPPPWQLHLLLPHEAHEQRHGDAPGQQHQEPPLRHLLVPLHEPGVHVELGRGADGPPALPPHVGAVEEQHVHDGGGEAEEPGADGDGEERAEVELAVAVIGGDVEVEVAGEHLGGVVLLARGGEELVGEDGEPAGVEGVEPPVAERHDDVDEHDEADGCVGDGRPRRHQRAAVVRRDARPVQREGADAEPVVAGPDLLRRDAARPHPARPREEGQDRQQVARERVVGEAREEEDEEEAHPRRALGRLPALLRLVQRPEEGDLGEVGRPPHLGRVNEEPPQHASPAIAQNLRGEDDEEGAEEAERLLVVGLHDGDGADGVGVAAAVGDAAVGEDGDDDVLLDVEGARVEVEAPEAAAEQPDLAVGQHGRHEAADGEHEDLGQDARDGERLRAVREEGVEEDEHHAGGEPQRPRPECHHRRRRVVRLRHHQRHLLHRVPLPLSLRTLPSRRRRLRRRRHLSHVRSARTHALLRWPWLHASYEATMIRSYISPVD